MRYVGFILGLLLLINLAYAGPEPLRLGVIATDIICVDCVDLGIETAGILPLAEGGTGASLTANAGGIVYSTSSDLAVSAVGSSGQVLVSGGTLAPSWTSDLSLTSLAMSGNIDMNGYSIINADWVNASKLNASQIAYVQQLGVGTTSPEGSLHLYTSFGGMWQVIETTDLTYDPNLMLRSATGGWVFKVDQSAGDILKIGNGSIVAGAIDTVMTLTSEGNIGIGTTTPSYKLDVKTSDGGADVRIKDSIAGFLQLEGTGTGVANVAGINLKQTTTKKIWHFTFRNWTGHDDHFHAYFYDGAAWKGIAFDLSWDGSKYIAAFPNGYVGIGTTDPTGKLDIVGNQLRIGPYYSAPWEGSAGDARIVIDKTNVGDIGSVVFRQGGGGYAEIGLVGTNDLIFKVNPSAGSWTERMRITSVGYVGIGTTSPGYKLEVKGTLGVTGGEAVFYGNLWAGAYGGGTDDGDLILRDSSGNNKIHLDAGGTGAVSGVRVYIPGSGDAYFNQGNVGIGTTTPAYKLDVAGDIVADAGSGQVRLRGIDPNAGIEVRGEAGGTPYIDFSNDATVDYDARIRLTGDNTLSVEGTNLLVKADITLTGNDIIFDIGGVRAEVEGDFSVHIYGDRDDNDPNEAIDLKIEDDATTNIYWCAIQDATNAFACSSAITKSGTIEIEGGSQYLIFTTESPQVQITLAGRGKLENGEVTINFTEYPKGSKEWIFYNSIDRLSRPFVIVTPLGECNGLYVAEADYTGFKVKELGGGTSNVEFDYYVIAYRRGKKEVVNDLRFTYMLDVRETLKNKLTERLSDVYELVKTMSDSQLFRLSHKLDNVGSITYDEFLEIYNEALEIGARSEKWNLLFPRVSELLDNKIIEKDKIGRAKLCINEDNIDTILSVLEALPEGSSITTIEHYFRDCVKYNL